MPIANETQIASFRDWTLRFRSPEVEGGRGLIVLLHGWTGNENVMWVFAHKLMPDHWIIAPRGLIKADGGGYGWAVHRQGVDTTVDQFAPACQALHTLIQDWQTTHDLDPADLILIGFSQGAALAFSYALLYPGQVVALAGLAGFLPQGAGEYLPARPLNGRKVFIAHGTRDDTVPISFAKEAVEGLEKAGAEVTYCETDATHKLGAACLRGLNQFFSGRG